MKCIHASSVRDGPHGVFVAFSVPAVDWAFRGDVHESACQPASRRPRRTW